MSKVSSIHIAHAPGDQLVSLQRAHLLISQGFEGDHHFDKERKTPADEVTLVAMESVNAFNRDTGRDIDRSVPPSIVAACVHTSSLEAGLSLDPRFSRNEGKVITSVTW